MWKSSLLQPKLIRNMSQSWRSFTQTPLESVNIPPAQRRFTAERLRWNVLECCWMLNGNGGDESDAFICPFLFSTKLKKHPQKTDFQGQNIFSLNVTEDIASVLVTAHALHMALAFSHYIWHSDRVTTSHKVEDMQGYNAVNPRLWISIKLRKPRNPEVLLMKKKKNNDNETQMRFKCELALSTNSV